MNGDIALQLCELNEMVGFAFKLNSQTRLPIHDWKGMYLGIFFVVDREQASKVRKPSLARCPCYSREAAQNVILQRYCQSRS
jgi:hypothetical protein